MSIPGPSGPLVPGKGQPIFDNEGKLIGYTTGNPPRAVPPGPGSVGGGGNLDELAEVNRLLIVARSDLATARSRIVDLEAGIWFDCFPSHNNQQEKMVSVPEKLLHALLRLTDGARIDSHDLMTDSTEEVVMYHQSDPFGIVMKLRKKKGL